MSCENNFKESHSKPSPEEESTVRDALAGTQFWGGIGAGKSSSSMRALAAAFLRSGRGGLVLAAKNEDAELWREAAAKHGRSDALIDEAEGGPCRS